MLRHWVAEFFRERRIVGIAVVVGFLGAIGVYLFVPPEKNEVLSVLVGALAAAFSMVVGHYFSEPSGKRAKEIMEEIRKDPDDEKPLPPQQ